jgi:hypothetical protein
LPPSFETNTWCPLRLPSTVSVAELDRLVRKRLDAARVAELKAALRELLDL